MSIRKFIVAAAAIAAISTAVAAPAEEDLSDQGIGAIGWTPVQIGLFAPVSYPWGFDWDVKGLEIDLFYAEAVRLQGLSISGVATRSRDLFKGFSVTGLCNWHDMDACGVDVTLGANLCHEGFYGLAAGAFSMRQDMAGIDVNFLGCYEKSSRALKLGGACNFTTDEFKGMEVALGLNMTKTMIGLQAGGINFAHELTGAQIGFFNIAEECPCGLQLGLINIIMDNKIKVLPITNFYF